MWFLWILSWVAIAIQFCVASLALAVASGLYYLAELVEEYASVASKVIRLIILSVFAIYIGFIFFEDMSWMMIACGMLQQVANLYVMQTFPYFVFSSPAFISCIVLAIVNHYFAFSYFGMKYFPFAEVLGYFFLCLWLVPFCFFVSLSANDAVLPTQLERRPLLGDENDVVSNYFSKRGKKYGLLTFFKATKELVLPHQTKKSF